MARVLKEAAENDKLWRAEETCTGRGWAQDGTRPCGRLIEVLATDIVCRTHTDLCGDKDRYYGFICPGCGSFTEMDKSKIPSDVRHMADCRCGL